MCAVLDGTFKNVSLTAHFPLLFLPHSGKNSTLFIIYYLFFIIYLYYLSLLFIFIARLHHPQKL